MKGVNIFLADGFEDIEALATYDILCRGGVKVNLVSVSDEPFVCSSHGLTVGVENSIHDMDTSSEGSGPHDFMIFPGGMPGSSNLAACKMLIQAMKEHFRAGGSLAAICAAPGVVLGKLGEELKGVEFTCYDGFEDVPASFGAVFSPKPAVRSGRIVTGRGPGHSQAFALEILSCIKGDAVAEKVRNGMNLKTV